MSVFTDPANMIATLKSRTAKGGFITVASRTIDQAVRLISTIILARLLTPAEFGLIAMITAVTSFMFFFSDMGLSQATIQKNSITVEQINMLFWINSAVGLLVTILTIAVAPLLVWFYSEPHLLMPMLGLAGGFLIIGLGVQQRAILQRHMKFTSLAIVDILASVLGVFVSIISAFAGLGVWSLVLLVLVNNLCRTLGVWLICPWSPTKPSGAKGIVEMLKFGGHLTGFNIINHFSRQTDHILIGWHSGAAALGLYNRAYSLLLLPIKQITEPAASVAVPALSRLHDNPSRYRSYFIKAVSMIAFISVPGVSFMILFSGEFITLALGPQWIAASNIFALLGISALLQPITNTSGWLFVSSGRADKMFKWGIFSSVCIVASFFVGLRKGAVGVASAYSICVLVLAAPSMIYAAAGTPVKPRDILDAVKTPFLSAIASAVPLLAMKIYTPAFVTGFPGLCTAFAIFAILYLAFSWIIAGKTNPVIEFIKLIATVLKPSPVSA